MKVFAFVFMALASSFVAASEWQPITDEKKLSSLFSNTTMRAILKGNNEATAYYNSDGTGKLKAWGDEFTRQWKVENQQACILIDKNWQCFNFERNDEQYRATNPKTNQRVLFTVQSNKININAPIKTSKGGASTPSADEIAKKLANPNTPLATLNFRLQYRQFEGDLSNASDQSSTTLTFQPSMPFGLENGDMIFFRPAIPIVVNQPVFNSSNGLFEGETALGDISFDLAYGVTTKTGWAVAGGVVSSLPTATKEGVGSDKFTLGPELLVAKLGKNYVLGAYPNHMWDVAGSGTKEINLTSAQFFGIWLPGGGWNVGTTPVFSYDHITDQATVPVNLTVGKTVMFDGRPWKFSVEFNYYVERSETISPQWMLGFNFGPVVENAVAAWFK